MQAVKHVPGLNPQNVVATVNLECKLDLKAIALHARNAEYNPKRFAAVIMRIREPKSTALIFASGKMVSLEVDCRTHWQGRDMLVAGFLGTLLSKGASRVAQDPYLCDLLA